MDISVGVVVTNMLLIMLTLTNTSCYRLWYTLGHRWDMEINLSSLYASSEGK